MVNPNKRLTTRFAEHTVPETHRTFLSIGAAHVAGGAIEAVLLKRGWLGYGAGRFEEAIVALGCTSFGLVLVYPPFDQSELQRFLCVLEAGQGERTPVLQAGASLGQSVSIPPARSRPECSAPASLSDQLFHSCLEPDERDHPSLLPR